MSGKHVHIGLYCDIGTMGPSRRLSGRWCGAGGCQFNSYRCGSRSPGSRPWGLSVQIDYLPCHYHLPRFRNMLDMPLRHQSRVLKILLNGLYLYLWLYVDSCFTPCKYQSIKYFYYYYNFFYVMIRQSHRRYVCFSVSQRRFTHSNR